MQPGRDWANIPSKWGFNWGCCRGGIRIPSSPAEIWLGEEPARGRKHCRNDLQEMTEVPIASTFRYDRTHKLEIADELISDYPVQVGVAVE